MQTPHFKILGWLWLLFGGFWCLFVGLAFLAGDASFTPRQPPGVIVSDGAWWEEVVWNVLECSFFFASLLLGVGLLRRWRWTQGGLAILGAVLLAVWVLLIVSPSFPPTTLAKSAVYLSPLLALALYSLAAVLLPAFPGNLSRRSKILTASGSVFGVFAAIGFHLCAFHDVPPNPSVAQAREKALFDFNYERVRPAADAFARDRRARGLALPATVSFQQLVSQGYLPWGEAAAFSSAEATVSFRAAEGSDVPWIRIQWKNGPGLRSHTSSQHSDDTPDF